MSSLPRSLPRLVSRMWPMVACALISLPPRAPAQGAAAAAAAAQGAPKALFVEILEGEGDLNDVRARTAREPIVEVQDENHKPVAGALVLFSIRSGSQAQANFSGLATLSVRTGADGRAVARGYRITPTKGQVEIAVTATLGALAAEALIHQTNYAHGGALSHALSAHKALLGESLFVAAYVAASITVVTEARSPSNTTITAGQGTVGAPSVRIPLGHR